MSKRQKKELSPLVRDLRRSRREEILKFTIMFAVLAAVLYGVFFGLNSRSMVWGRDGLTQHCLVLAYYGEYLRTILKNIFIEHTFVIPMFDFSIGFGSDIVESLHYYGLGDPLNLLSVFVKPEYTEYLYGFISILRMYLSGITFILYMSRRSTGTNAVMTGAVAYAFSGYCVYVAARHPFFIIGIMYLPLLFLGVDKILNRENPLVYIISVALILLSNFYFAYMSFIMMLFYAAMRYFDVNKKKGAKTFFKTLGKFAAYTVNGFLISMVIFLPQVENTLATGRLNADNWVGLFYEPSYYSKLLSAVTDTSGTSYWLVIGYTGVSLLCLMSCFVRAKKHKNIVISICICVLASLFPIFGHIMNGFSYVCNRWSYIFSFLAAVAVVYAYEELFTLSDKEKKTLLIAAASYVLLVCCFYRARTEMTFIMIAVMFLALCVVMTVSRTDSGVKTGQRIVTALVALCVVLQGAYTYNYTETGSGAWAPLGDVIYYMRDSTSSSLVKTADDSEEFFRYDDYYSSLSYNAAALTDTNSTACFLSIANPTVAQFMKEIGLNDEMEQLRNNLGYRYILQSLFGVKYQAGGTGFAKKPLFRQTDYSMTAQNNITVGSDKSVSYYAGRAENESESERKWTLSELKYYMPMGYTYDAVMTREEYEELTPVEKQNVLLQTAVTDGTDALPKAQIREGDVREHDIFEMLNGYDLPDGISVDGNKITVTDTSAKLSFTVPAAIFSECCVTVSGLKFTEIKLSDIAREEVSEAIEAREETTGGEIKGNNTNKLDTVGEKKLSADERSYTGAQAVHIYAQSDMLETAESLTYYTPRNSFYSENDTFVIYLGTTYIDDADSNNTDTIAISFSNTGTYEIDNFLISYQGLSNVKTDYKARTENVLENVEITDNENTVKGTISLSEPKVLATQIPYSSGWTATVDGEKQEIINVNTAFCGLVLEAGEYTIEFSYKTPHTTASIIMSLAGIALAAVAGTVYGVVRRKREQ